MRHNIAIELFESITAEGRVAFSPAVRTPQDWIIESERLAIKMISINFIKVTGRITNTEALL